MRTTGNTIFVDGITGIVHRKFYAERNKCFFKSNFTEKRFADFNRVKSSITKKSLRSDKGMLLKEINQTGSRASMPEVSKMVIAAR